MTRLQNIMDSLEPAVMGKVEDVVAKHEKIYSLLSEMRLIIKRKERRIAALVDYAKSSGELARITHSREIGQRSDKAFGRADRMQIRLNKMRDQLEEIEKKVFCH